ncbi:MAG: ABC transporter permease, partial [Oscillospiraceae bacterium]
MSKTKKAGFVPLIRVAKRESYPFSKSLVIRLTAIVIALLIDALIITSITDVSVPGVFAVMYNETFGNLSRFSWALRDIVLLLGIGIALAPAFKMKFWNIGAEGQVLAGALAASVIMYYANESMGNWTVIILMCAASIAAGALWGFIPAFFKAKWGTNETLFTLMMNYVAIQLVSCMTELWRGKASAIGKINPTTKLGWMPSLKGGFLPELLNQRYTINILIIIILVVFMYFYLKRSKHGYEISVVGESENTARYAGINVKKVIIRTMIISGAICGLFGFLTVSGKDQTISTETAGGNGFTAIIVAWVAKFNTFTMAAIAFLLILLRRGAEGIASQYGLNSYLTDIVSGIVLFFILGCEF